MTHEEWGELEKLNQKIFYLTQQLSAAGHPSPMKSLPELTDQLKTATEQREKLLELARWRRPNGRHSSR